MLPKQCRLSSRSLMTQLVTGPFRDSGTCGSRHYHFVGRPPQNRPKTAFERSLGCSCRKHRLKDAEGLDYNCFAPNSWAGAPTEWSFVATGAPQRRRKHTHRQRHTVLNTHTHTATEGDTTTKNSINGRHHQRISTVNAGLLLGPKNLDGGRRAR